MQESVKAFEGRECVGNLLQCFPPRRRKVSEEPVRQEYGESVNHC